MPPPNKKENEKKKKYVCIYRRENTASHNNGSLSYCRVTGVPTFRIQQKRTQKDGRRRCRKKKKLNVIWSVGLKGSLNGVRVQCVLPLGTCACVCLCVRTYLFCIHKKLTHKAGRPTNATNEIRNKKTVTTTAMTTTTSVMAKLILYSLFLEQRFLCFFIHLFGVARCYGLGSYAYTVTNVHEKLCAAKTAVIHT